jgi:diketogulonate reductase-like aldo/keto reductase
MAIKIDSREALGAQRWDSNIGSPPIIYGTAWKNKDTERLVAAAIRLGFRAIDTACQPKHYDEARVGAGVARCLDNGLGAGLSRADLYLQTKFTPPSGQDPNRMPYDPRAPLAEQVQQSVAVSLRNLRTDYLDAVLLHSPLATASETMAAWRVLESLVDSGQIRKPGISNVYDLEDLRELYDAARIKPAIVQNRFYPATGYDAGIRAFCRERAISYQSFWTLTGNTDLLSNAAITIPASRLGWSRAQVLFRYLTQAGVVPLTGTRSEAHMRHDLAIFEFELSPEERNRIDRLVDGSR